MTSGIPTNSGRESVELASLRSERDVELRAEGILNFASRLESRGREGDAAEIYQSLVGEAGSVAERARRRLEVLQGGGPFGAQVERLARNFVSQATDPALLLGMGLAGTVASLARVGILTRLAASPAAFGTRGLAARLFAGGGALALEAPAFTVSTRFVHSLLGRPQDPTPDGWGRELASGYLLLGSFRLSGGLSRAATARWLGAEAAGGLGARLFHQGGMLAGLMAAHALETQVGLREGSSCGDALLESLAALMQLNVAGRLSRELLGARFLGFQTEVEQRTRNLQNLSRFAFPSTRPPGYGSPWLPAGAGSFPLETARSRENRGPQQLLMAAMEEGGGASRLSGNGSGNGRSLLQRANEIWAEWLRQDAGNKRGPGAEMREAVYEGEGKIPEFLDELASSLRGRPVLFVQLDVAVRPSWPEWGRDFLERHPHMEEIILSDPQGEGWWVGRPPLADMRHVEAHFLSSPDFRPRQRPADLVFGLRLRDNWKRWSGIPPIAEYLRQLRGRAGLSTAEVAARLEANSSLKAELKSYRMAKVEARHIRNAESGYRLPVAFPLLRRMAGVYGEDVRRLILSSNQSLHSEVPRGLWTTESYPIYLESQADLGRLEYFRTLHAEGKALEREFAWLLWSARKNPERYRTVPDLAASHRLTQSELGAWELGQRAGVPSFQKMKVLSEALGLPVERIIHAVNRTYYPDLPVESLFPDQSIYIDSKEHDPSFIRAYARQPGSIGQYVFAARKRLPERPGRVVWSRAEGFNSNYLYERESNRVKILPSNLSEWTDLFRRLEVPQELLKVLAKVHGKILMSAPVHLLAEGGVSGLQPLSEKSGLSTNTIIDVARLRRRPRPETIRDLGAALPDLDAGSLFLRAHPEVTRFFPELGSGPVELQLGPERLRQAAHFHLGTALFAHRHDNGVPMAAVAARLDITKQTVSLYESVFVRIQKPEILEGLADFLGLDRRMLYLHFNPEIIDIFPVSAHAEVEPLAGGSRAFLREANGFYDRSNLRRLLMAAMGRQRLLRGLAPDLSPVERVSRALQVPESEAKKLLGEARILNSEDIRRLLSRLPALDYAQWYGHFHRSSLAYFLGVDGAGRLDYRIPQGLPGRAETPRELFEGLESHLRSRNVALTSAEIKSWRRSILRGRQPDSMSLARLARERGLDRRWLYFHFRRAELAPFLKPMPKT